jgi:hypothetical protein
MGSQIRSAADNPMIQIGSPPYLECSSRGDKRFSAFFARPVCLGGMSIERAYQYYKVLEDGSTHNPMHKAKGKRATNAEQLALLYKSWWRLWVIEARLIPVLVDAAGLSDMFGQEGHVCQANVLWEIRQDAIDQVRNGCLARKSGLEVPGECGKGCNELECRIQ